MDPGTPCTLLSHQIRYGRDWFPSQRSLARFSHPDPRWPGLIDAAHFCLVAVSTHAGVEEKLFGLAIAPHHYLLHGAGCHVQTHVTSLAQHKRKETSFLRSLAEGFILHLQNLAEVLVQLTKQANIVSREPGQPGCRQPNASLMASLVSRALWSTRPHAFRHRLHVTGAHRGRPLQIVRSATPSEATWPHLQREATLSPSSVPSSSSLLKPRCSRPPLSVSLSLFPPYLVA